MRTRKTDVIDTWLWTWGALAADLSKIEDCAGRVMAAEWSEDRIDSADRRLTAAENTHSDPTQANVAALSSPGYLAVYTIHAEVCRWPRIWRGVIRDRFVNRLDWTDVERRNELTERDRKSLYSLMKRELGMSLRLAGVDA